MLKSSGLVHCLWVSLPSLGLNSYMQEHSEQQTYVCEGPEKPDPVRKK